MDKSSNQGLDTAQLATVGIRPAGILAKLFSGTPRPQCWFHSCLSYEYEFSRLRNDVVSLKAGVSV